MLVCVAAYAPRINKAMLYHSYSYSSNLHVGHRAAMMAIACIWIGILFALVPRREIPWITYCGKNTMTIFILHGFVIRTLGKELSNLQLSRHWPLFIVMMVVVPLILTLPPVVTFVSPLMRLKRIREK